MYKNVHVYLVYLIATPIHRYYNVHVKHLYDALNTPMAVPSRKMSSQWTFTVFRHSLPVFFLSV